MAKLIAKQFPFEGAPTPQAYARHAVSLDRHNKVGGEVLIFFEVFKSAEARQAPPINGIPVGGVEHSVRVPASSDDPVIQAALNARKELIRQLIAAEYALASLLDPTFASGTDQI